jgi:hypothetical protein
VIGGATTADGSNGSVLHLLWTFQVLATNDMYDPATNKWVSRTPMSVARNHAFGAAANGKIYVIGGAPATASSCRPPTPTWWRSTTPSATRGVLRKNGCLQREAAGPRVPDGRRIFVAGGEVTTTELVGAFKAIERMT